MRISFQVCELVLKPGWKTARGAADSASTVIVRLEDETGQVGFGEAAPISRYGESIQTVLEFLSALNPARLNFADLTGSQESVRAAAPGNSAAKCAIDVALTDGAAKLARQSVSDFLGLGFTEHRHVTSVSIGIGPPESVYRRTLDLAEFPILKLKMGGDNDRRLFEALRRAAPDKPVRVDANEAWKTKEQAHAMISWLAQDRGVEFVEQPMPAGNPPEDWCWLKERSPLPIFADESFHTANDVERCARCFHGVNVKLSKTGGIGGAFAALRAAHKFGLQTMIGCMIETSILISAAAQLAELANFLDLDGNLLVSNDPFCGLTAQNGVLSFKMASEPFGIQVSNL